MIKGTDSQILESFFTLMFPTDYKIDRIILRDERTYSNKWKLLVRPTVRVTWHERFNNYIEIFLMRFHNSLACSTIILVAGPCLWYL